MPRLSKIGAAALAAFGWTSGGASAVTASYLVVAGGGAGGSYDGGGGGAGGYQTGTTSLNTTLSYTVVVGAGGAGQTSAVLLFANSGSNSQFGTLTASVGGGGGGSINGVTSGPGVSGGSGGGGSYSGSTQAGGLGTSGQGNNGGTGGGSGTNSAGGGGGAGAVGGNSVSNTQGGAGGAGLASSISGTSTYYAGGGGGGSDQNPSTQALGGVGGGGNSAYSRSNNGTAGAANTGGGGGGGVETAQTGYSGGSGVVIISYPAPQKFGGGIVTTSGSNVIHTFNTSGTLAPLSSLTASYLIVAGGAGGGRVQAGGGGAGGLLSGTGLTIDTNSTYLVTVGAGGAGSTTTASGVNGSNSAFSMVTTTAVGGGGGGSSNYPSATTGSSGGSGGGGSNGSGNGNISGPGGAATSGQGNIGGYGWVAVANAYGSGGGGGGAGTAGANAASGQAGAGGAGVSSTISGTSVYYAGGGGGGGDSRGSTAGAGGNGGGGAGGNVDGVSGTANTGGGGGGGSYLNGVGGAGGSGVVIISYAGSVQQMAGGTVTISGGNVIHTFTSSGYLTPLTFVGNSLRWRASNSAYLNRTPNTAGNRKTWTWSAWVKRGSLTSFQFLLSTGTAGSSDASIYFTSVDGFKFEDRAGTSVTTAAVYRDPAAWYHLVCAIDTTQATASNRVKLYVNGSQITSFDGTPTYPTQNADLYINNNTLHYIGRRSDGYYFDGEQTNINFIDGQALTPNSFGTFNSYGVWQPITYGGSYGTNGFYLPFNAGTQTYAGSFNGSNQGLTTTATGINASTGTWTIEGWAYSNNASNDEAIIVGYVSGTNYFYWNYVGTTLYFGDGVTNTLTISNAKPANQWFHWAAVKNGSTYTLYINGQSIGSTTTALRSGTLTTWEIGIRTSTSNYWSGAISNVRVNSTTAVYTSNFTPPTANLTAISGTQLLTLQNATIIDNSTNAYAITNTGSVTTALNYPFSATKIFADQGPAGNNWTPNNISGQNGSTLDYMTDVPTLTSATAANYAVANPLDKGSSINLSNGNLTYAASGVVQQFSRSTIGVTSGKWYYEVVLTTIGNGNAEWGVANQNAVVTTYIGSDANGWGFAPQTSGSSYKYNSGSATTYGTATGTGTYAVAIDADTGKVWFSDSSGAWISSGNPASGTNESFSGLTGTLFAAIGQYSGSSQTTQASINFGQQPFKYTPPSGFVALNTYNL